MSFKNISRTISAGGSREDIKFFITEYRDFEEEILQFMIFSVRQRKN